MTFAGLPRKEFRKAENIHFLATSSIVPSVPLGRSIASDLQGKDKHFLLLANQAVPPVQISK